MTTYTLPTILHPTFRQVLKIALDLRGKRVRATRALRDSYAVRATRIALAEELRLAEKTRATFLESLIISMTQIFGVVMTISMLIMSVS